MQSRIAHSSTSETSKTPIFPPVCCLTFAYMKVLSPLVGCIFFFSVLKFYSVSCLFFFSFLETLIMLISYFILLTTTSVASFLPGVGFAIPTHAHTRVHGHGHGHGHGQRHGHTHAHTHATHYDLPTAEELALPLAKRNHQCTSMFQRKAW